MSKAIKEVLATPCPQTPAPLVLSPTEVLQFNASFAMRKKPICVCTLNQLSEIIQVKKPF